MSLTFHTHLIIVGMVNAYRNKENITTYLVEAKEKLENRKFIDISQKKSTKTYIVVNNTK